MRILVTNDDGILAEGLWVLVSELKNIAQVVVAAPDREQSAIGTAVTLNQPLVVQQVKPQVPGVDAYSIGGTPSDCVILALSKLVGNKIDMVVSGINQGANLGDDVLISGTVAAALQGYLRGLHTLAISVETVDGHCLDTAARSAALLARWVSANSLPGSVFLNVNLPALTLAEIKGVEITRLASGTHTDAAEEGNDGKQGHYRLVRHKADKTAGDHTDVWAIERGNISVTPLHIHLLDRSAPAIPRSLCSELLQELRADNIAGYRAANR